MPIADTKFKRTQALIAPLAVTAIAAQSANLLKRITAIWRSDSSIKPTAINPPAHSEIAITCITKEPTARA